MTYCRANDVIEVEFQTERGVTYKYEVEKEVARNKIKLAKDSLRCISEYEEYYEIGAQVEIYWSEGELLTGNQVILLQEFLMFLDCS